MIKMCNKNLIISSIFFLLLFYIKSIECENLSKQKIITTTIVKNLNNNKNNKTTTTTNTIIDDENLNGSGSGSTESIDPSVSFGIRSFTVEVTTASEKPIQQQQQQQHTIMNTETTTIINPISSTGRDKLLSSSSVSSSPSTIETYEPIKFNQDDKVNGLFRIKIAEITTDEFDNHNQNNNLYKNDENQNINNQNQNNQNNDDDLDDKTNLLLSSSPMNYDKLRIQHSLYNDRQVNIMDFYPSKVDDFKPIIEETNQIMLEEKNSHIIPIIQSLNNPPELVASADIKRNDNIPTSKIEIELIDDPQTVNGNVNGGSGNSNNGGNVVSSSLSSSGHNGLADTVVGGNSIDITGELQEKDEIIKKIEDSFLTKKIKDDLVVLKTKYDAPTMTTTTTTTTTVKPSLTVTTTKHYDTKSQQQPDYNNKRNMLLNHRLISTKYDFIDRRVKKNDPKYKVYQTQLELQQQKFMDEQKIIEKLKQDEEIANTKFNADNSNNNNQNNNNNNNNKKKEKSEFSTTKFYNNQIIINDVGKIMNENHVTTVRPSSSSLSSLSSESLFPSINGLQIGTTTTVKIPTVNESKLKKSAGLSATTSSSTASTTTTTNIKKVENLKRIQTEILKEQILLTNRVPADRIQNQNLNNKTALDTLSLTLSEVFGTKLDEQIIATTTTTQSSPIIGIITRGTPSTITTKTTKIKTTKYLPSEQIRKTTNTDNLELTTYTSTVSVSIPLQKPYSRQPILTRLEEKINSLDCDLINLPPDSNVWRGNETHELNLPITSPENCSSGTDCLPMIISWEGTTEIQSGDVLLVVIDDALLLPSDFNKTKDQNIHKATTAVYQVTRLGHENCDITEGVLLDITPLVVDDKKLVTLYDKDLTEGINLLIVVSELWKQQCVRLRVTVKSDNCGENAECSGKGVCFSNTSMEGYECQCCNGFAGSHCEEIDACSPSPCTNNGICVDLSQGHEGNSYQCLCPYGYTGKNCQFESEPCNPSQCLNGGTCIGNSTNFRCECTQGYTGPLCQHNLNECESSPCVHGICVDQEDGFRCFCQPGFSGELCNFEYNECESNPCLNGGQCTDHIGGYSCKCTKGYTGKRCHIKVDFCANDPCPEGHRCVDRGDDFTCDCPGGRNGPDCNQVPRTICNVNPCANGGTCWTSEESFYCACRPGFTGKMCEDDFVVETVVGSNEIVSDESNIRGFAETSFNAGVKRGPIELHNAYIAAGTLTAAIFIVAIVVTVCHCKVNQTYRRFATRHHQLIPIFGFSNRNKSTNTHRHWLSGKGLQSNNKTNLPNLSQTNINQQQNCHLTSSSSSSLRTVNRPMMPINLENDMYYTVDFSDSQNSPLIQ